MKLIAHRANIDGPNSDTENNPKQIQKCIEDGYDVEIDVRYDPKTERLWLGHDEPQYAVTWWWLAGRSKHLWIHCKDITTLHAFSNGTSGYNYFWHQEDDFTLTSKNFIWTYPNINNYGSKSIIVNLERKISKGNYLGVCSDYVDVISFE